MVDVGKRLTELRKGKNLSMAALAKIVGVSRSLISQVEKNDAYPSLQTLSKIVEALGTSMSEFFRVEPNAKNENALIVRSDARDVIYMQDSEMKYYILSPSAYRDMEFLISEFPPYREGAAIDYFRHEGHEYFYVLKGQLQLTLGDETYLLNEGDSGGFDAGQTHYFVNKTNEIARLIVAATEPCVQINPEKISGPGEIQV